MKRIETAVGLQILSNRSVSAVTLPLAEAKKIEGVRAVFGEKYPDPVRVVTVGPNNPMDARGGDSVEFCGGTHVPRTGEIGYFKIVEQTAVAKGIRRVTAVTGRRAMDTLGTMSAVVDDLIGRFNCKPG